MPRLVQTTRAGSTSLRSLINGFIVCLGIAMFATGSTAHAVETVTFREDKADADDEPRTVIGELMVEAQDGGVMLMADDGRIWTVQPNQIVNRKSDEKALLPIDDDEMARRMVAELPKGFAV